MYILFEYIETIFAWVIGPRPKGIKVIRQGRNNRRFSFDPA